MNSDTLRQLLINTNRFNHKDGSLNITALAKVADVNQPTLKRILDGESKQPRLETIQRICSVAGIDMPLSYGISENISQAIPQGEILSAQEKQLISMFRSLSSKNKKLGLRILSVLE